MAYYPDDDENQGQGAPAQGQAGGGVAVSKPGSGLVSGSTSGGGNNAPGEAAKQTTPGNTASPFVGINEYLKANKQQTGKLGETVGGFVGGKVDTATQKLQGAEQNFGKQVDDSTVKFDQNLANQIKADPTALTKDPNQVAQVKNMAKGYAGPADFKTNQAYQEVNPFLQKAQTATDNLGSAQGQKQLLTDQQLETRGGKVNRGAATLDQALLQASPQAREALKPAQEKGQALKGTIDQTIQNAMNRVTGAQKQSAETNKALQDLFREQFYTQESQLQARAADVNTAMQGRMNDVKGRLSSGALTDEDLGILGISKADYDQLKNDFSQYAPQEAYGTGGMGALSAFALKSGDPNATIQNVATADEYARAQALRELAGSGGDYLSNPAQAESYGRDFLDFDLAGARNFINPKKAAAEQARLALQQGGGGSGVGEGLNQAMGGGMFAPVTNAVGNATNTVSSGIGSVGGGVSKAFSDKNLKKDVKHFDAKKFLEAIGSKK